MPPFKNDLKSNFGRLDLFLAEVVVAKRLTFERYRVLLKQISDQEDDLKKKGVPTPVFSMHQFSDEFADIEANFFTKSYFFVARQAIERLLRVIYLSKEHLEPQNVQHSISDGAKSGNFPRFIKNVVNDIYEYDPEILAAIKQYRDLFIITRVIRNALKSQGAIRVTITNGDIKIICPITSRERKDSTLRLLRTKLSVEIDELKNLIMEPPFLDQIEKDLKLITELVRLKISSVL